MSIVKKIKNICVENDMSLAELERAAGLTNGSIRRWDDSLPNIKNVEKVADYFKCSVDFLLGRDESEPEFSKEEILIARDLKELPQDKKALLSEIIKAMK